VTKSVDRQRISLVKLKPHQCKWPVHENRKPPTRRPTGASPVSSVPASVEYIYRWDRQGRKGEPCHVLARGTLNSCLVEFRDGYRMVTSRNAIRKA
jgi:hypothetical protein